MSFIKVLSRIERATVDETRDNHTIAIDRVFKLDVDEGIVEIFDHKVDITAGGIAVQGPGCCNGLVIGIDDLRHVIETYYKCKNPEVE